MMDERTEQNPAVPPGPGSEPGPRDHDRREFLRRASSAAMLAGLVGGYGAFGSIAGRFLYPARPDDGIWQFVSDLTSFAEGKTLTYKAPTGETVNITRRGTAGTADDFIALSSVCPHLGCQVHWEGHNNRYFCPCHNGTFDPAGVGTGGPPGDAGQSLPQYPLRVEGRLLYILVPALRLASADASDASAADGCATPSEPCPFSREHPGNSDLA